MDPIGIETDTSANTQPIPTEKFREISPSSGTESGFVSKNDSPSSTGTSQLDSEQTDSTFISNTSLLSSCKLCSKQFSEERLPRQLSCSHYYHTDCLEAVYQHDNIIVCPQCESPTKLPNEGVRGLSLYDNFSLNSLDKEDNNLDNVHQDFRDETMQHISSKDNLDTGENSQNSSSKPYHPPPSKTAIHPDCTSCMSPKSGRAKAIAVCDKCNYICENCAVSHRRMHLFLAHKVTLLHGVPKSPLMSPGMSRQHHHHQLSSGDSSELHLQHLQLNLPQAVDGSNGTVNNDSGIHVNDNDQDVISNIDNSTSSTLAYNLCSHHHENYPGGKDNTLRYFCEPCDKMICEQCATIAHHGHTISNVYDVIDRQIAKIRQLVTCVKGSKDSLEAESEQISISLAAIETDRENALNDLQSIVKTIHSQIESRTERIRNDIDFLCKSKRDQFHQHLHDVRQRCSQMETAIKYVNSQLDNVSHLDILENQKKLTDYISNALHMSLANGTAEYKEAAIRPMVKVMPTNTLEIAEVVSGRYPPHSSISTVNAAPPREGIWRSDNHRTISIGNSSHGGSDILGTSPGSGLSGTFVDNGLSAETAAMNAILHEGREMPRSPCDLSSPFSNMMGTSPFSASMIPFGSGNHKNVNVSSVGPPHFSSSYPDRTTDIGNFMRSNSTSVAHESASASELWRSNVGGTPTVNNGKPPALGLTMPSAYSANSTSGVDLDPTSEQYTPWSPGDSSSRDSPLQTMLSKLANCDDNNNFGGNSVVAANFLQSKFLDPSQAAEAIRLTNSFGLDTSSTNNGGKDSYSAVAAAALHGALSPSHNSFNTISALAAAQKNSNILHALGGGGFPPKSQIKRTKMIYHCKFGEFGVMESQFTEPSGVAVNTQNDIIVADTNNHRIQVFDCDGRYKFQFGECGKRDGQLLYPNRVAVYKKTGDIVVTERSPTHQVQLFTAQGEYIRKFGSQVLQHPRGVTVDNKGVIIIVECKVMRVIAFHMDGQQAFKFGCSKHLEFPNGVAVDDNEQIFISDNRAHAIKVFNYKGNFIKSIGEMGSTNFPIGVGISGNGQIVVADNHNNFNVTTYLLDNTTQVYRAYESKVKHAQCFDVALMDNGCIVLASKDYRIYIYRYEA